MTTVTTPTRPAQPTYAQLASGEDEWIRYLFGPSLVPLRPGLPASDAITHAELAWRVEQRPLMVDQGDRFAPITTHVANVRSDTRAPIGVVGAKYRPIQNREALAVAEAIIDTGGAHWVGIAQTRGGARTHAILRLPREVRIGGDEDERILPLLRLTNTHDGSSALSVSVCPYRVVCRNGLALPLSGAERTWRVRHTVNADYRIQEARRALGVSFRYLDQLERVGEQLAAQPMHDAHFEMFLSSLLPITATTREQRARQTPRVERARQALRDARDAPDLANVRETRWGALQAVTSYATHDRPTGRRPGVSEADATFERVSERAPLTDHALTLLTT
jgi:phage/plasmid-like protein (TIGR03299 family)